MKIQYLGTGAAERVPAIFCNCAICKNARKVKGREIRTQTQVLIDEGKLMIDFPGDSYLHLLKYQLNYNDLRYLLITHWHSDHFYPEDLAYRMQGYSQGLINPLTIFVNSFTKKFMERALTLEEQTDPKRLQIQEIRAYDPFQAGKYRIFPLPAQHGHFQGDATVYAIQDPEQNKTLLWLHDTGYPTTATWDYLVAEKLKFDLVSMDGTSQTLPQQIKMHMNWDLNLRLVSEMKERGLTKPKTQFVVNHFSHNGGKSYEQMVKIANPYQIMISYDGLTLDF